MKWSLKWPFSSQSGAGRIFSMNDPQWGRGGGEKPKPGNDNKPEGPPDLDELWKDFNQNLNRFFGRLGGQGGNGQGGGGGAPSGFRPSNGGVGALMGIVALIYLSTGFFTVQEGKVSVVTTFGKYSETVGSGVRWRMPYPFQSHELVNVSQVRTVEVGYRNSVKNKVARESLMLTDDENIIDLQFAVQYKLKSPEEFLFVNRAPEEAVLQAAETAVREVVGRNKMDFVLYEGREQIGIDVAKLMQDILDRYKVGVQVSGVTVQNAQPPEQVQASFDDAVKAGQDAERLKNEGQAYANDVIPKAKGAASRLLQEAEGYKQRVIAQAEGDAARFKSILTEYAKAPQPTRDRMYIDAMQQVFTNVTKVMVESKQGSQMLYLPLDKLINSSATDGATKPAAQATGTAGNAPTAGAENAAVDAKPRANESRTDSFRNRDREAR